MPDISEWHPVRVLRQPAGESPYVFDLVILNQPIKHRRVFSQLWNRGELDFFFSQTLPRLSSRHPSACTCMRAHVN